MKRSPSSFIDLRQIHSIYIPRDETWCEYCFKYLYYYCCCGFTAGI